ncbi:MAG: hypothetical protein K6B68_11045 [Eubacterium sp.]|nr:hypothetical protein [Eubacterium sp.]
METIRDIISRCLSYNDEQEWFDFKDSWFDPVGIGQVMAGVVFDIILFLMAVYIFIHLYNVKRSQMYSRQNENNEGFYLAKLNRYRYIINNIDECSEEELNDIINIDCANLL